MDRRFGFNLIFLRNDGVTFGMLGGAPWWALSGLALVVTVWLTVVLLVRAASRLDAAAYGLVIGGALGNVADRLRFGAVTDFLDVYVGTWHWPAFNLADVAVVGGVGLLLLSEFWQARNSRRRKGRQPGGGYSARLGVKPLSSRSQAALHLSDCRSSIR